MQAIDYRQKKAKWWRPPRWFAVTAGLFAGILILWVAVTSTFTYVSVCPICGDLQHTTEWQVPFTEITYWTHSSTSSTLLSATIVRRRSPGVHPHNWLFAYGAGNGVQCALGDGQGLW